MLDWRLRGFSGVAGLMEAHSPDDTAGPEAGSANDFNKYVADKPRDGGGGKRFLHLSNGLQHFCEVPHTRLCTPEPNYFGDGISPKAARPPTYNGTTSDRAKHFRRRNYHDGRSTVPAPAVPVAACWARALLLSAAPHLTASITPDNASNPP